jgi:hypothetical protein
MRHELKEILSDTLLDPSVGGPVSALLDHHAIRRVWDAFQAGSTNWARPWALFVVKSWGQRLGEMRPGVENSSTP